MTRQLTPLIVLTRYPSLATAGVAAEPFEDVAHLVHKRPAKTEVGDLIQRIRVGDLLGSQRTLVEGATP